MIIDTHCHYNMSPLYENWQQHWRDAQQAGVTKSIVVGTEIETSRRSVDLALEDENLLAAIGVHPNRYSQVLPEDLPTVVSEHATVLSMMLRDKPVVAIGETGLDYYRLKKNDQVGRENQRAAFKAHIELANEFQKVLIVHVRDQGEQAYWDALEIIKKNHNRERPFILHCSSGPAAYLQEAAEMGGYFGVAGNITYPNAQPLRDMIKSLPADRILLETDAPFLAPQKYRGQKCLPHMIAETARFVETELNLDSDQLEANFNQLGL